MLAFDMAGTRIRTVRFKFSLKYIIKMGSGVLTFMLAQLYCWVFFTNLLEELLSI